jgi:peptidoglycan/LPS O-acetylase OafA/YrhL
LINWRISSRRDVPGQRLAYLEAMRGVAALVVVFSHCLAAFNVRAIIPVESGDRWYGMPWYVFLNGAAAVNFFFVLSGYVLTLRPLQSGNLTAIGYGALKRWPRLAGPVLVTVLISWALWQCNAFWNEEAAKITGSTWLARFGYGFPPPPFLPDLSLQAALREGLWGTFVQGSYQFDASLWTMTTEFYGSFLVFALAAALIVVRWPVLQFLLLALAAPLLNHFSPYYIAFWFGISLAWLHSIVITEVPSPLGILMVAVGIFGLGYVDSVDAYAWIPTVNRIYVHSAASVLLIMAATSWEPLRRALNGPIGRKLGVYSFPIYLVHLLVIMSLGMAVFVALDDSIGRIGAVIATVTVSLAGSAAAAHVLALIDRRWVSLVNRSASRLFALALPRSDRDHLGGQSSGQTHQ